MVVQPIQIDLFALAMGLGVVQGALLGVLLLTGPRGRQLANRCLGLFLLALSAISIEIFLSYTNYTFRLLWTVDLAEPFNFVLGPLFYFFVVSRLTQRLPRRWGWHLVPFGIWTINAATWIYQPATFKYNSYLDSWHPELAFVPAGRYWPEDPTGLRDYINEMTILSAVVYAGLGLLALRRYRQQGLTTQPPAALTTLRWLCGLFALVPVVVLAVKPLFHNDGGDYLIASYITLTIYGVGLLVMRGAPFFQPVPADVPPAPARPEPRRKYEKSALSEEVETAVLQRLNRLLADEKPYLSSDLSLPRLAARLDTSPHHLSQLLNDRLDRSFFDLMADYRVREAQQLLVDPATAHLKIDDIAERVGYNSTSAFHTAFKRLTGQTPAQYRQKTASRSA